MTEHEDKIRQAARLNRLIEHFPAPSAPTESETDKKIRGAQRWATVSVPAPSAEARSVPAPTCGNEFTLKSGYVCELERGHAGKHYATCPNPAFSQTWSDEFGEASSVPAPTRKIDGKFSTDGVRIFNTVSGEEIPEDEPLFLLRGRDWHAQQTLRQYLHEVQTDCNDLHIAGATQVLSNFEKFAKDHPERMKQPGITRHLKLEASSVPADSPKPLDEEAKKPESDGYCDYDPLTYHEKDSLAHKCVNWRREGSSSSPLSEEYKAAHDNFTRMFRSGSWPSFLSGWLARARQGSQPKEEK